jgi:hypothetical protein
MYGTIFRLRPKAGHEQHLSSLMEEFDRERGPRVKGARASYLLKPDRETGELIGVAIFDDRETYRANAEDPEQDAWYRKLREHLESDPVWEDGEFISAQQYQHREAGRS